MALLTAVQWGYYADTRRLYEYASDTGTPLSAAAFAASALVAEIIAAAEQEVISACLVGNRYTVDDLTVLAADNVGGSVTGGTEFGGGSVTGGTTVTGVGAKLRRLVAEVAWGLLLNRRKVSANDFAALAPGYKEAQDQLELLRLGERIFPIGGVPEAGLPSVVALGEDAWQSRRTIASQIGLFGDIACPRPGIMNRPCC